MNKKSISHNIVSSIVLQAVVAIYGFFLPHLIIIEYGSSVNGMITSITQFLSYLAMIESGIRASSIVELYRPLAEGDTEKRNYVLSATKKFYLRSGFIYSGCLVGLIFFYPFLVNGQIDLGTTRWMIVILASSNIVDYYILGKYQVLLAADQKTYIINFVQAAGTLLNLLISVALVFAHRSIILVKATATCIYVCRTVFIIFYVRKYYKDISFSVNTSGKVLPQRWSALVHQIAGVICNNTDLVLITLLLRSNSLLESSVYYVFSLATNIFSSLFNSISSSIIPSFGKTLSSGEIEEANKSFNVLEYVFFIIAFIIYTCMSVLLLSFVSIYTKGSEDANYYRPILAVLFVIMGVIQNIRIPSMIMICAGGHYKQTQGRAIVEAVINISISVILIIKIGIEGAVIGTISAYAYRSFDSIIYNARHFVKESLKRTIIRLLRNTTIMIAVLMVVHRWFPISISSWGGFLVWGCCLVCISSIVFISTNVLTEPKTAKTVLSRLSQ